MCLIASRDVLVLVSRRGAAVFLQVQPMPAQADLTAGVDRKQGANAEQHYEENVQGLTDLMISGRLSAIGRGRSVWNSKNQIS